MDEPLERPAEATDGGAKGEATPSGLTRREFLGGAGATLGGLVLAQSLPLRLLKPLAIVDNPLGFYPDRNWEKVYRDQYRYDSSFTFVCSPNDTHHCRLRAFVRNGVIVRIEQNYDVQRYADLYGNKATPHWNPRGCLKGYTFHRRVYGPHRLKYPMVRAGWKQWADDGFPELTAALRTKYRFDSRGTDTFERVAWGEVYAYIGNAFIAIARRYSGPGGARGGSSGRAIPARWSRPWTSPACAPSSSGVGWVCWA
jgi:nitrate reductase alpha subunit